MSWVKPIDVELRYMQHADLPLNRQELQMTPLRSIRVRQRRTLAEVADAVGVSRATLSRVETCKQRASAQLAADLARLFKGRIAEVRILYPERYTE